MANTAKGKRLTEQHRRAQIKVREQTERKVRAATRLVDSKNLDGSWAWKLQIQEIVDEGFTRSSRLAEVYLDEYSLAETGAREESIIRPMYDRAQVDRTIQTVGVAGIKAGIGQGLPYREAVSRAVVNLAGALGQTAVNGGRSLIDTTIRYSGRAGGYRRVTDGSPCAFCAMLAGRGPVYSQETAYFESHRECGCTAEPVYGQWSPSEREAEWIAVYTEAARQADLAGENRLAPSRRVRGQDRDTILYRMRRIRPDLFHDGVTPHA